MALAIKRVHNLPCHLSYVSTLPDITQNWLTSWSRSSLTLVTIFLKSSLTKPLTCGRHGCVHT